MTRPNIIRAAARLAQCQRRSIHVRPPLEKLTEGIDGLMTPNGFRVAWSEYQGLMVEKLNALTVDSEDYNKTVHALLLKYARNPQMASLFNHASQAHNNHFFFKCLTNETVPVPSTLKGFLERDFGSMQTLRDEMVAIGNSMFGPGYVWLVQTDDHQFKLLNTYIAGTPYAEAHYRRQPVDMNTETDINAPADQARRQALRDSIPVNAPDSSYGLPKTGPNGARVTPVLCLSTWQHVYIADWGVLQKKAFMEAWWERIDWEVVASHAATESRGMYTR